ncbi:MAG TPA: WHG domain-containing protein [Polyangiaceae bacterium]|nr:WHG domain-containing protein [Polyangiaceae bacterium]
MADPADAVARVFEALRAGRLTRDDLTARRLAAFLGQSTIGLYHHFGSLDGFLIRVDGAGWRLLFETLARRDAGGASAGDLAVEYLDFAFRHPHLYWLMGERPFDRAALRREGRLALGKPLWAAFLALLERHGSCRPALDARALLGGLHGLAALTLSGRANFGEVPRRPEELAREAARRLAEALLGPGGGPVSS